MARPYLVPDMLQRDLRLVFCGTAPSAASARARAYYAKPGNQFWPTLHRCGFTPSLLLPQDYAQLLQYGIGLTDLCKIHSGNDDQLPDDALDIAALEKKIRRYQPRLLAFTSKTGASAFLKKRSLDYGLQKEMIGRTRIFVCCSTSGRARGAWREEVWRELAEEFRWLAAAG